MTGGCKAQVWRCDICHRPMTDPVDLTDMWKLGTPEPLRICMAKNSREIERFFDGFEILAPGVVWTADWRPDPGTWPAGRPDSLYGGVGRKPAP